MPLTNPRKRTPLALRRRTGRISSNGVFERVLVRQNMPPDRAERKLDILTVLPAIARGDLHQSNPKLLCQNTLKVPGSPSSIKLASMKAVTVNVRSEATATRGVQAGSSLTSISGKEVFVQRHPHSYTNGLDSWAR